MTEAVIGFDTSNYRTSAAVVSAKGEILYQKRLLLPVAEGETGLRQSEAVFAHVRRLPMVMEDWKKEAGGVRLAAVAASAAPRDGESSYMPVFQAGVSAGKVLADSLGVPFYETTHQRGHLAAAVHGTCLEGGEALMAFHLSGGTTDLLFQQGETLKMLGYSGDLHAGQLVDRIGVALGLPFPAGPYLEELARQEKSEARLGCSLEKQDLVCHFSGAEAQAKRWLEAGTLSREEIAMEIYDFLARTCARMLKAGARKTGLRKALVMGGIAGSDLFRNLLTQRCRKLREAPEPIYGDPALSGDNAVGVALIGAEKLKRERSN